MKKTLTVGIPAHNEEKNIGKLLDSLFMQIAVSYTLQSVVVCCDGCTDTTAEVVRKYMKQYPMLSLVDDGHHIGQAGRLNEIIQGNTSDVLVLIDADTVFGTPRVLEAFSMAFDNPKRGLVAGADTPYAPRTFFESIVVTTVELWRNIRVSYNGGDTVHNAHGCILALSQAFAKRAVLPKGINGADHFLYFATKQFGFDFYYAQEAIVYYREPDNLTDFVRQRSRFHGIHGRMVELFGPWIETYYVSTPLSLRLKNFLFMFLNHPFLLPLSLLLELYMRLYIEVKKPRRSNGLWETIHSTK